jgi:hypothetical protein
LKEDLKWQLDDFKAGFGDSFDETTVLTETQRALMEDLEAQYDEAGQAYSRAESSYKNANKEEVAK